ncbi:hypothetical protein [Chenggangzhangella methanolivorans]
MGAMAFLFRRNPEDPARADASRRVAALVREIVGLDEDDAVTVSEIACGDPACGGAETVVLLMRAGRKTEAVKLMMPMAQVAEEHVRREFSGR